MTLAIYGKKISLAGGHKVEKSSHSSPTTAKVGYKNFMVS
jgi:hypothetical protein